MGPQDDENGGRHARESISRRFPSIGQSRTELGGSQHGGCFRLLLRPLIFLARNRSFLNSSQTILKGERNPSTTSSFGIRLTSGSRESAVAVNLNVCLNYLYTFFLDDMHDNGIFIVIERSIDYYSMALKVTKSSEKQQGIELRRI